MLLVTARLVTTDGPVMVQIVPLLRLTLVVEVASVRMTPVRTEALAFSVTKLPAVESSRLFVPALAVVALKLTVATDGSAKIRSPEWLLIVKLSKVAIWPIPPVKEIALPAVVMTPPPVASTEAPFPCRNTPASEAFVVLMVSAPVAVMAPAEPPAVESLATNPYAPGPDVVIVADARLTLAPAPSATTPFAPKPVAGNTPPEVATEIGPVALTTPPRLATTPLAPAPWVVNAFDPLRLTVDPAPVTNNACASWPEVVTEPPIIVVTPPLLVTMPSALEPVVRIVVSVSFIAPPLAEPGDALPL